jgi:nucleotide-binding universal stress UspA family protein
METIIVPTDFSAPAANATEYAVELAKFFDASLVLVNAYPLPTVAYEAPYVIESVTTIQKASQEKLENLKSEILLKYGNDMKIHCYADMGMPFDVISAADKEFKADLIVMGIVGEAGGFKEKIIGSNAVSVARKIDTPTFIIPENVKYKRIRKIAFACDLNKTEETDLVFVAKFFSKVFDAELEIVNVGAMEEEVSVEKAATYLYLEQKLENVKHQTTHIVGDDISAELEDYFEEHPVDVVMMNPKKHNLFYNLFHESVTNSLAFHTKLPLLTIH